MKNKKEMMTIKELSEHPERASEEDLKTIENAVNQIKEVGRRAKPLMYGVTLESGRTKEEIAHCYYVETMLMTAILESFLTGVEQEYKDINKFVFNYTDKAFLHLDADDRYYYVYLEMKSGADPISEKAFTNEMLAQSVRHEVYLQTKNIRELMLARAMATTIVDEKEVQDKLDCLLDKYSEDEILKDWFSE